MSNVRRLVPAEDEYRSLDHVWNQRAQRFLRDMRMLGAESPVIAELLRDLLWVVEGSVITIRRARLPATKEDAHG